MSDTRVRMKDGNWYYRYTYKGQRRERKCKSKEDGEKQLSVALAMIENGRDPDTLIGATYRPPKFSAVIDEYLNWLKPAAGLTGFSAMKARRSYMHSCGYGARLKAKFFGTVEDISQHSLRAYAKERSAGAGTTNREVGFLAAAFRWYKRAHPRLSLPEIIWSDARIPHDAKPRDRRVTDSDLSRIAERLPDVYRALPAFAVATMMRSFEIRTLDWSNVRQGYLELAAENTKGRRGNRKSRRVPLTARAQAILDAVPGPRIGLVFKAKEGGFLWGLNRAMVKATRAQGMEDLADVDFHCFRHEGASRYMENGGDLRSLMDAGGWRSLELVERYSHPTFEREREIMERGEKMGTAEVVSISGRTAATSIN